MSPLDWPPKVWRVKLFAVVILNSLVAPPGNDPRIDAYQASVIPFNYRAITGSHFCATITPVHADQAVPRTRTWSVFFAESLIRLLKRT